MNERLIQIHGVETSQALVVAKRDFAEALQEENGRRVKDKREPISATYARNDSEPEISFMWVEDEIKKNVHMDIDGHFLKVDVNAENEDEFNKMSTTSFIGRAYLGSASALELLSKALRTASGWTKDNLVKKVARGSDKLRRS